VSLGDLGAMSRLLHAAESLGKIRSDGRVQLWVTEFSWDSDAPDTSGSAVPTDLEARWVAEAQYRAWEAGATLFAWHQLRDLPYPASPYQGGLYFTEGTSLSGDTPKPALSAFRFPFVALPEGTDIRVWGRTPGAQPRTVIVEQESAGIWRFAATLETDEHGIFEARLPVLVSQPTAARRAGIRSVAWAGRALPTRRRRLRRQRRVPIGRHLVRQLPGTGGTLAGGSAADVAPDAGSFLRARLADGTETSLPFSLTPVPDRAVNPFGG